MEHVIAPLGERHPPHNFEYANAAARTSATVTDATLVQSLALQLDDGSYWRLTGVSPATWTLSGLKGDKGDDGEDGQDGEDGAPGTTSWTDLEDKPTTLTGFGITDAEPTIPKFEGFAKWISGEWTFVDHAYIQTSHVVNGIDITDLENWDLAFGWGNHAAAGYARVGTVNNFSKAQRGDFFPLTDAATVTIDLDQSNQFNLVLGGNRTLGVPTNARAGQQGIINVYQPAAGNCSLTLPWPYGGAGGAIGTLSTAGLTKDMLAYSVDYAVTGNPTLSIATPCVVTMAAHGLISGQNGRLSTTGALPTNLAIGTTYYVRVIDANSFYLSTSLANAAAGVYIATTGSQTGVHTFFACGVTVSIAKATP